MPIFQYKAYNAAGKEVSGEVEAISNKNALQMLKKDGLYPKEISAPTKKSERFAILRLLSRRTSLPELAAATTHLSTLLASGAALSDALSVLIGEEENRYLRDAVIRVRERISEGSSLSGAMDEHPEIFPDVYRRMVEAGEASGTLDNVLKRLAEYLESSAKIQAQIKTALIYPAIMTIVGFGVLSFLFIFVIPKITKIFEDTKQAMPLITVILLTVADFFRNYWPIMIAVTVASILGFSRLVKRPSVKAFKDRAVLRLPLVGEVLGKFYIASFARTLGSLLESGVPILKAMNMTKRALGHAAFEDVLNKAIADVTEGAPLSGSLKGSVLIPGLLTHMVAIGEKSGKLDILLLSAASAYEKDFETAVARTLSLLEPFLILAMGLIVGFMVLAILLPIFELNQIVR
ncbi:MAG: type II secretion system inner membrane protein GspF [Deltaproteobacteria bacterium]|nr:type II secretion system inner membrane protein GspF [Deltaproteobacteria bacterium]